MVKELAELSYLSGVGLMRARREIGRPVVDGVETAVFIIAAGILGGIRFDPKAVEETYRIQDIIERQNCQADSQRKSEGGVYGSWKDGHFLCGYATLLCEVADRYKGKFGEIGMTRYGKVIEAWINWFKTDEAVESWVLGRRDWEQLSVSEKMIVKPVVEAQEIERGLVHKEVVDKAWLSILMNVLYEGDSELIEKELPRLLNLCLCLQLSEDFVNLRRDKAVGKVSMFTSLNQMEGFWQRMKYLWGQSGIYIRRLVDNPILEKLLQVGLVVRTGFSGINALTAGDEWRNQKQFTNANNMEAVKYGCE